ncbi:MAG: HAD family hydrolase [Rhodobacteraceae bacterium]|nr:HAD family hydrolase [Paracoccaceae bacterium]
MNRTPELSLIAFDADDTLWQNEAYFRLSEQNLAELLGEYSTLKDVHHSLIEAERRNLKHYGYGVKGFTLSMIETAIEITDGRVPNALIRQILDLGRDMLSHPVELLPGARDAIEALRLEFTVILLTKGDLIEQERKVAHSRMGGLFHAIEIVSEKSVEIYRRVFHQYGDGPDTAMMVGNSIKSDILPSLQAGSWGVYVPHRLEWELEAAAAPRGHPRFRELSWLGDLPPLIRAINTSAP